MELRTFPDHISAISFHRTMVTAPWLLVIPFYHTVPQRGAHGFHHRLQLKSQFRIKRNRIRYIIIHKDALRDKHYLRYPQESDSTQQAGAHDSGGDVPLLLILPPLEYIDSFSARCNLVSRRDGNASRITVLQEHSDQNIESCRQGYHTISFPALTVNRILIAYASRITAPIINKIPRNNNSIKSPQREPEETRHTTPQNQGVPTIANIASYLQDHQSCFPLQHEPVFPIPETGTQARTHSAATAMHTNNRYTDRSPMHSAHRSS